MPLEDGVRALMIAVFALPLAMVITAIIIGVFQYLFRRRD